MKKCVIAAISICMITALFAGCSGNNANVADLVVYGTIYTAEDENNGLAEAFAVKDGKYIYVGNKEGVKQYIKDGKTEVIDRTDQGLIIPGCTEGHSHYFGIAGVNEQFAGVNCSYQEMLKVIKEQVESDDIKQFVTFGWGSTELLDRINAGDNFAEEIESIAPGIPVVLVDNTGHAAVCNTTALKKADLLENPNIRGGQLLLDAKGQPNGYLNDQAVACVLDKALDDPLTDEQYQKACKYAVNTLLELGYTNALDAYINHYSPKALYGALKKLDDAGELNMNVAACYNIRSYDADKYKEKVDEVGKIVDEYKSTHLNPAYIKLFTDGIVEAGTGWMLEEYKNVPKGTEHGNQIWKPEELNALVEYANSKNILIHTHSYGNAACKATLDAYIASNKANGGEYRNSLGHVRNIQPEDAARAAENKILISANLIWHTDFDDSIPDEAARKNLTLNIMSEDTYYSGYPMKSLMDKGVLVSSSTDAPVAETIRGSIMNVLEVATTGVTPNYGAKPFAPNELLTVKEGLKALTINGAWQLGLEKERGSVKVGKYADFVILDKNILDYQGKQLKTIHDTKILNTYFEGKNVYAAQ